MADSKTTALTELTDVDKDDILMIIDDPNGTPTSKKATVENVLQGANTLDANTTPALNDILLLIDDPSGTPKGEKSTIQNLFTALGIKYAADADSDTDDVLGTSISSGTGLMLVSVTTDDDAALYRVEGSTLTAISANSNFSTTKDTGSKYNVYYETDQYKVQNKVGDNKDIKVWSLLS